MTDGSEKQKKPIFNGDHCGDIAMHYDGAARMISSVQYYKVSKSGEIMAKVSFDGGDVCHCDQYGSVGSYDGCDDMDIVEIIPTNFDGVDLDLSDFLKSLLHNGEKIVEAVERPEKPNTVWLLWNMDYNYGGGVSVESIFTHKPNVDDLKEVLSYYEKYMNKTDYENIIHRVEGCKIEGLEGTKVFYLSERLAKGNKK